jgi:hypothetical protein
MYYCKSDWECSTENSALNRIHILHCWGILIYENHVCSKLLDYFSRAVSLKVGDLQYQTMTLIGNY